MRRTSAGRRSRRWQCGGDADATAEGVEPVPTGRGPGRLEGPLLMPAEALRLVFKES